MNWCFREIVLFRIRILEDFPFILVVLVVFDKHIHLDFYIEIELLSFLVSIKFLVFCADIMGQTVCRVCPLVAEAEGGRTTGLCSAPEQDRALLVH